MNEQPTAALAAPDRSPCATRFEYVEAWGMAAGSHGRVWRPGTAEEVGAVFAAARAASQPLALRGAGCSYGDASTGGGGDVLELSAMNRILSFDADAARIEVEGGVTIEQLWRFLLPRGHWPRVVPGTMAPTLAGVAAMNIHGKNNYKVGTFGDCVEEFDIVLPGGELRTVTRASDGDLFHGAIGGFGMLGCISRLVLRTHPVHSGDLQVEALATRSLGEMMGTMEARRGSADYLVGWIDAFAGGDRLGRGLLHAARYLAPGEDREPRATLTCSHQELPENILGVLPKSELWRALRLFNNAPGMRAVNAAKCMAGRMEAMAGPRRQPHAAFAFLLDFVPNWKFAYGRRPGHGLIQYQAFVPAAAAREVFEDILRRCQSRDRVPFLAVFKRHRPDPFWLTHAPPGPDGSWSLALDFKVTPATRGALWSLCHELTARVLEAGGRFYFAKDLTLAPPEARAMYPEDKLAAFLDLKRRLDPDTLLQTDLWRRLFGAI